MAKKHQKPNKAHCLAVSKNGKPCVAYALEGGQHCRNHDPRYQVARRENGAVRKPKPVSNLSESDVLNGAERPRTLAGIADSAFDLVKRLKANVATPHIEPRIAEAAFKGLRVATDALKAIEEGKRARRGVVSALPAAGASGNPEGSHVSAPSPPTAPESLLGRMVAARKAADSVQ
jgi:hypothetical protein